MIAVSAESGWTTSPPSGPPACSDATGAGQGAITAGEPARLMGYRVLICEDMPDVAANALVATVVEGELRQRFSLLSVLPSNYKVVLGSYIQGEQGQRAEGPPHPVPQSAIAGLDMSPTTLSLAGGWP